VVGYFECAAMIPVRDTEIVKKNCSQCGAEFRCGATGEALAGTADFSCWCTEVPNVPPVAGGEKDCLCPECLAAAVRESEFARDSL